MNLAQGQVGLDRTLSWLGQKKREKTGYQELQFGSRSKQQPQEASRKETTARVGAN